MFRFLLLFLLSALNLSAAEYFVRLDGDDHGDGSREKPFRTIGRGGRALAAGDTLTIGPGEYFESVELVLAGDSERQTVIRSEMPGSVLIRGDRPIGGFVKVDGFRYLYRLPWEGGLNAVNERDTLKIYLPGGSKRDLEFFRGRYFLDREEKMLYISTSDGEPPEKHELTASVVNGIGLAVTGKVENIVIDGLSVTGFYAHSKAESTISQSRYGIFLAAARNCVVRNCRTFLNSNGIFFGANNENCVIERCVSYANGSPQPTSGGNIIVWGPAKNGVIRDCVSFFSNVNRKHPQSIRFYANKLENCLIENCISFGDEKIWIKGTVINSFVRNSFCEGGLAAKHSQHNVYFKGNDYLPVDAESLPLAKFKGDHDRLFADPKNFDFRPQGGAKGIEKGWIDRDDVRFVAPDGDDRRDGRSLATAWKTAAAAKPGTTVYLLPGVYRDFRLNAADIAVKTRGRGDRAVLENAVFSGDRMTLRDLDFRGPVSVTGDGVVVECCRFDGKLAAAGAGLRLVHNEFKTDPELGKATGYRHSNIGIKQAAGTVVSLDNGVSFDALPLGPYRLHKSEHAPRIAGPFVRSVTDTTANLEWWAEDDTVTSLLSWGEDRSCPLKIAGESTNGASYHSASISGLTPGKTYYFKVAFRMPPRDYYFNSGRVEAERGRERAAASVSLHSFATERAPSAPVVRHVGAGREFTTISAAMEQVRAGDTVVVHEGRYTETVFFRSGGDRDKPITLSAAPGEKVVLDGGGVLPAGIVLNNQSHIVIDGFRFQHFRSSNEGAIRISGGGNILIRRCFYDGRGYGYTPPLFMAYGTADLTVADCVIIRGFYGAVFSRCPRITLRNCVWYMNQIYHVYGRNLSREPITMTGNIFGELIPTKFRNPLIQLRQLDALKEESDNCYYVRLPEAERKIFGGAWMKNKSGGYPYAGWLELSGRQPTSILANPEMPVLPQIHAYAGAAELVKESPETLRKVLFSELRYTAAEGYIPLDFSDFATANPELKKRRIGLQFPFATETNPNTKE